MSVGTVQLAGPLEWAPSNARGADSFADADKQANAGSGSVMPYQSDLGPQSAERDWMESLASTGCSLDASRSDSLPRERADNKRRRQWLRPHSHSWPLILAASFSCRSSATRSTQLTPRTGWYGGG